MKNSGKILLLLTAVCSLLFFQSSRPVHQKNEVKHLMRSYRSEAGFIGFGIPAGLIRVFVSEQEDPELKQLLKDVRMVRILVNEGEGKQAKKSARYCSLDMLNMIHNNEQYKQLLQVKSEDTNVSLSIRENRRGMIKEILILAHDGGEFFAVEISGTIDPEKLMGFTNKNLSQKDKIFASLK